MSVTKEKVITISKSYLFNQSLAEIKKLIEIHIDKRYDKIADILNKQGLKSKTGLVWTAGIVSNFMRDEMGIRKRVRRTNSELQKDVILSEQSEILPNYEIKDLVFEKEGKFFTDSLKIASVFEKEHSKVIDIIKKLIDTGKIGNAKISVTSYTTNQNKTHSLYLLDRDIFSLVVMGFTGDKALDFKLAYINQFNQMEQSLKEQYSKPIQKELSAMELMAITLKGFQEQETKVLFQIKKESESIKHETNKALESQRKEIDIKIQEIDNRLSAIPMIKEKVYTQTPFVFPSSGLKDTEATFKHKDSTLLEQREDLREDISKLIKELASTRKVTLHNAWSIAYALLYKQLEKGFYDEFIQINDNRRDNDKLAKIDYILSKDMGTTLFHCIKRLIHN